ncbi:hypothetical protein [Lysinibacillus sp. NPDC086135]|uniref:hypothetical protein n=1 Tax=Lysinibacillus sp. NPDC086135 TaxID=3364130 RepID=UPI0037F27E4D
MIEKLNIKKFFIKNNCVITIKYLNVKVMNLLSYTKSENNFIKTRRKQNASNLKPNYYTKSSSSYYIKKGEKVNVNSVTWSPSGQKIKLGFVSATGGSNYWTEAYVGGSKTGGSFYLGGPTGEYYIAILADSGNNANLGTVTGSFDF